MLVCHCVGREPVHTPNPNLALTLVYPWSYLPSVSLVRAA